MLDSLGYLGTILGVAIGFSTIMLLLSLVVTSVVQVIQNVLGLRFRNLALGIHVALKSSFKSGSVSFEEIKNSILKPPLKDLGETALVKPKVTWIEPDDLIMAVKRVSGVDIGGEEIKNIKKSFEDNYAYLRKRFMAMTKYWSFAVGLIIALVFQVDSLDLLRQLSTDPQMRSQLEMTARGLIEEDGQAAFATLSYEDISDSALVLLQAKYPGLAPQLEQASGIGDDREAIIEELDEILSEEKPDMKDKVLEAYGEKLDDLHRAEIRAGLESFKKHTGTLAVFDIRPLQEGWDYYWSLQRLLGMLVTSIFLALGGPFWFNLLRKLINLKDELSKPKNEQTQA